MLKAEEYAREIVEEKLGKKTARIRQFSTGLSHFVFDVLADDDFSCVIRIARPERTKEFERGIFWHEKIELTGVRLPQILEVGEINGHHFAVYERLKGDDLENVYSSLSAQEKRGIAETVAGIQQRISSLDQGLFERIYSWAEVLRGIVSRSEREILSHGLCNPKYINLVRGQIEKYGEYIETLKPVTFLYDLSVRNVIVDNGKVTGIIDVDDVWFGDPLLAIGRGKTILLAMRQDTDFIEYWCKHLELSAQEMEMVELYALLYCLRFMGTLGTRLNGNPSIQTDPDNARLFESIAENILGHHGIEA
ncbi:MAG: aminoglycoside phosphotransferase family protein [Chloroflexi bacterium]|nr:aminoglycoside phosphotransferase family protein [Chloroflexota bacterium]